MPDLAMSTIRLPLDQLQRDGGTQPRIAIDYETAYEYGDEMQAGAKFPPVVAFYDGATYWLADGFHRAEGAFSIGCDDIEVEVHQGTLEDAQWYSFGVNKSHGLRRTNEDKQRAVKAALAHPNGAGKSNSAIAKHVGVDEGTVRSWREKLSSEIPKIKTRTVTRNGTTYQQNTANIGKRQNDSVPVVATNPSPVPAAPQPERHDPSKPEQDLQIAISHAWAILGRESTPSEMADYFRPEYEGVISGLRRWVEDMEQARARPRSPSVL
jgi:transposase-like protein